MSCSTAANCSTILVPQFNALNGVVLFTTAVNCWYH